jgi:hypothetical protein
VTNDFESRDSVFTDLITALYIHHQHMDLIELNSGIIVLQISLVDFKFVFWFLDTVLGGVGTMMLMIDEIEPEEIIWRLVQVKPSCRRQPTLGRQLQDYVRNVILEGRRKNSPNLSCENTEFRWATPWTHSG